MNNSNVLNSKLATKEQIQFINRVNRNLADPLSNLNHLEAVGHLFGLKTKAAAQSKVWHVGGYKLINSLLFANNNPEAEIHCTHLDDQSYNWVEQLSKENVIGKNIHFHKIADSQTNLPQKVDYISFSGLYGRHVLGNAEDLFAEAGKRLSSEGLMVVDYPVLPGSMTNSTLASMFRFHCNETLEPEKQYGQALALLKFIEEAYEEQDKLAGGKKQENLYRSLITDTKTYMTNEANDLSRLMLDFLVTSSPQYFVDFLGAAFKNKLKFIAESNVAAIGSVSLPENTRKKLAEIKNFINLEQYLDFITNKRQRQSILCNVDIKFNTDINKDAIANVGVISLMRPEKPEDLEWQEQDSPEGITFVSPVGNIALKDRHAINAMYVLMKLKNNHVTTPHTLIAEVQKRLKVMTEPAEKVKEKILTFCTQMVFSGLLFAARVGEVTSQPDPNKPLIDPLILDLSSRHNTLPNQYYFNIEFDQATLLIIRHINGKNTPEDLVKQIMTYVRKGDIVLNKKPASEADEEQLVRELVEQQLQFLWDLGFRKK